MTATGLYRLDRAAPPDRHDSDAIALRDLSAARRELLEHADRDGVDASTQSLRVGIEPPVDSAAVWEHLQILMQEDPTAVVLRELERAFPEYEIEHLHHDVYEVRGTFPNPVRAGGEVLEQLPPSGTTAVIAISGKARATIVRHGDRLTVVRVAPIGTTYASYRLGPLQSIRGITAGGDMAQRARLHLGPQQRPSPAALQDLQAAGLLDP